MARLTLRCPLHLLESSGTDLRCPTHPRPVQLQVMFTCSRLSRTHGQCRCPELDPRQMEGQADTPPSLILPPPRLSLLRPSRCPAHTLRLLATGHDPRLPDEWATEHPTTGMGGPVGQELLAPAWGWRRCRNLKWPPAQTCPLPLGTSLTPAAHCDLPSEHHLVTRSARISTCLLALGSRIVPGSGLQRSSRHRACPVVCTAKFQAHVGVRHPAAVELCGGCRKRFL